MIVTKEICDFEEKSKICGTILRALPSWFNIESGIADYIKQVKTMPFYVAFDENKPIGFVAIKIHNPFTAEIYVMGILEEYHRKGIGKNLINICETFCVDRKIEFLIVKTLDESAESEGYKKTRLFYQSLGFKPLEVFPAFWDESNPCLLMVKSTI